METAQVAPNQSENAQDLEEIKCMCAEMVELRVKLDADQASRHGLWKKHAPCVTLDEDAGYAGQHGGSDGAYRDVGDYDNGTQEEGNWIYGEDEESDQGSLSAFEQITVLWAKVGNNQQVRPLVKSGAGKVVMASPFSSFRTSPTSKPLPEVKATEITKADKTKQKHREFVLDTDLQDGALLMELRDVFKKVKKGGSYEDYGEREHSA